MKIVQTTSYNITLHFADIIFSSMKRLRLLELSMVTKGTNFKAHKHVLLQNYLALLIYQNERGHAGKPTTNYH